MSSISGLRRYWQTDVFPYNEGNFLQHIQYSLTFHMCTK